MINNYTIRLLELDALRGLAAFSVLCYHYTFLYSKYFPSSHTTAFHFQLGQYGVELFFIISGFVIYMTLEKTERPLDFVVSRFSRLYPCYWVSLILTFVALRIFPLVLPAKFNATFKDALFNITMLQEWLGAKHVAGVYWTLTIELSFYFFIFTLFILRKFKYIEIIGLCWLLFMLLEYELLWRLHFYIPPIIKTTNLLFYGHLFFAGILFYKLKTEKNVWYRHVCLALCLAVQYILRDKVSSYHHSTLSVVISFFLFYLFIYDRLSWILQKPLIYLGTISYSLYLIHEFIGYIIINHLYAVHTNPWLCFLIPTASTLLLATIITYGVEKPAMNYIRHGYNLWKKKHTEHKVPAISLQ